MAQGAYAGLSGDVTMESQWGTLEQLFMSPHGFGKVMFLKAISNVVQSMVVGGLVLAMMLVTTQRVLAVDVVTIVPITLFALLSVVGLGFIFAGLALIYKRIGSISNLMQFGMIALVGAPIIDVSYLRFLPLVQGSAMLQEAMRFGTRLWQFSAVELGILVGTAFLYLIIGYAVFRFCSRIARKRGVMGHY
ncbi:ABC transporter permease [Haladaptatus cibarius]|uniref:ABC transporter permease n=1 Tax=Haladaptatus cibarius TaxID=453847 RepID=UPI001B7FF838|nr:ABC transporter permease [Haladaptatus cibarius]